MSTTDRPTTLDTEFYSLRNSYITIGVVKCLLHISIAMMYCWTSVMLPSLKSSLNTTLFEDSAILSSFPLGLVVGPFIGASIVHRFGYKRLFWLFICLSFVSTLFLYFLTSVTYICLGRGIAGLAAGAVIRCLPEYCAEIAHPSNYGRIDRYMALDTMAQGLGYMTIFNAASYFDYSKILVFYLPLPLIFLICQFWLPESPLYYLSVKDSEKAKLTISFLHRGVSTRTSDYIVNELQGLVTRRESLVHPFNWSSFKFSRAWNLVLCLAVLTQLSGGPVVLALAQTLLQQSNSLGSPESQNTLLAITLISFSFVSGSLSFIIKNNHQMITSSVIMTISMAVLGLYFLNFETGKNISNLAWVPIPCMVLFLGGFQMGFAINTDKVINVLNCHLGSFSISLIHTLKHLAMFLVFVLYFTLVEVLGSAVIMWFFAVSSVVMALFVYLLLPETNNVSAREVQEALERPLFTNSWCTAR